MKRKPLTTGDEYDALTKAKKYYNFKSGDRKKIKKNYNKKERKWLDRLLIEADNSDKNE
jgi:hypothetical protein